MSKLNVLGNVALVCAFCALAPDATFAYTFTSLLTFNGSNGELPYGALVQGFNGNLYGTTAYGGGHGAGTVFEFTAAGKLKTLYRFCTKTNSQGSCLDGATPYGGLVQGTDGNLYGTTSEDGANINSLGGTVFKITPAGELTTLYSFCSQPNCTDGDAPFAGLVHGADGNFYGTTLFGGPYDRGTVFEITPAGELTTLHSFQHAHGPEADLVLAPSGNIAANGSLWSTTAFGGSHAGGTLFGLYLGGRLITRYDFCSEANCGDGREPTEVMQATNGKFYGGTLEGNGTIYSFDVGFGPFVETLPTSSTVGTTVIILGNNLTGTTSVTFNGTPATFTVVSNTEITTTVPSGATTGEVQVTTPTRTLTSNVNFQVN
jgi:uncharacterized repeat protein (TIGR03803 family)